VTVPGDEIGAKLATGVQQPVFVIEDLWGRATENPYRDCSREAETFDQAVTVLRVAEELESDDWPNVRI
jgi:hypothetical protein